MIPFLIAPFGVIVERISAERLEDIYGAGGEEGDDGKGD